MHGQRVVFDGYLSHPMFMLCGKDGWGDARCPLTIEAVAGGPSMGGSHSLWIYLGTTANRMQMPMKSKFQLEDIEVFGDDGQRLALTKPVRIEAKLSFPDATSFTKSCSLDALVLRQAGSP